MGVYVHTYSSLLSSVPWCADSPVLCTRPILLTIPIPDKDKGKKDKGKDKKKKKGEEDNELPAIVSLGSFWGLLTLTHTHAHTIVEVQTAKKGVRHIGLFYTHHVHMDACMYVCTRVTYKSHTHTHTHTSLRACAVHTQPVQWAHTRADTVPTLICACVSGSGHCQTSRTCCAALSVGTPTVQARSHHCCTECCKH